jgi:site-specific DNA-cytosine methylase
MKLLELFSGTCSVGKEAKKEGWKIVSLDLKGADINTDILNWDYTKYEIGYFDIIWASPPCNTFSQLRNTWIGRKLKAHGGKVCTKELLQNDINTIGLPILRRTEEIIDYFKPKYYFIENPKTGKMKDYINRPYYDVDYCKYSDWGYKKRTRIWTNLKGFEPKLCKKDCGLIEYGKHIVNFGGSKMIKDDGKLIKVKSKENRIKYKNYKNIQPYLKGGGNNREERYRIPPNLIRELFNQIK